jgi:hypothetical protein
LARGESSPFGEIPTTPVAATPREFNHLAMALALLPSRASTRVTCRIQRSTDAGAVTFTISGEMDEGHAAALEPLLLAEANRLVHLDLADVTLVNRDAMKFLARVEVEGAVLVNCPEYVRSWIDAEQRRVERV